MDANFAEWYREGGLEPNGENLPKRWAAIESFTTSASDIADLVHLFFGLNEPNPEFLARFRGAFQSTDTTFPMRNNDQELSILSGAVLAKSLDAERGIADLASFALVTTAAQNLRGGPPVREIPERAARRLSEQCNERVLFNAAETDKESESSEIDGLRRELAIVAEECNILWWLFSEHSRDEGKRWTEFGIPEASLMVGKELADLTRASPGHPSTSAFLERVIRCVKKKTPTTVGVVEAINGLSLAWRKTFVNQDISPEIYRLIPISSGIKISLTAPESNAWTIAFSKETGISSSAKLAPNDLAYQLFLESMLTRQWKAMR